MKTLQQYINEYLIKKKVDKVKVKEYKYTPKTWEELYETITKKLLKKGIKDLNCIDTSNITNMSHLFKEVNKRYDIIGIDISEWDVSNVENFDCTFCDCKKIDCDLHSWDVSSAKNMNLMFANCEEFNSDLSHWNVSNVEDMHAMFLSCYNFDCDLSKWDVRNVKDMYEMFLDCKKFEGKGLEKWDVSKVEDMRKMFHLCNKIKNKPSWYKE